MYKVVFKLQDKTQGNVINIEKICYTDKNIEIIKEEIEYVFDEYYARILLIKEVQGFIL